MKLENFIFEQLYQRAALIVPPKEIKNLPKASDLDKSWIPLSDLIFVIERFLNTRLQNKNFEIILAKSYTEIGLNAKSISNLNRLKKALVNNVNIINNPSSNFLPPSSKSYLQVDSNVITRNRYNVDFINDFFGIRHFHLAEHKDDTLLFYSIFNDKIYFLKIGQHIDIYEQATVEILVNEFPELSNHLGIVAMPDMPVNNNHKYLPREVADIWRAGGNVSYIINDKYYTSCYGQTFSKLNTRVVGITQKILFQIGFYVKHFNNYLKDNYPEINVGFDIEPLIYDSEANIIEIGSTLTKDSVEIKIDYLHKLKLLDTLLSSR